MGYRFNNSLKVLDRLENRVLMTARHAQESYLPKGNDEPPEWLPVLAALDYLETQLLSPHVDLHGLLSDPSIVNNREFQKHLKRTIASGHGGDLTTKASAYTGEREFSA